MSTPADETGTNVSITEQLSEAFQLGAVLARIEESGKSTGRIVEKIDTSVTDVSQRLGTVEIQMGRQDQRIYTLEQRDTSEFVTNTQLDAVKEDIGQIRALLDGARLTWPKLLGGAAAFATIGSLMIVLYNFVSGISGA